MSREHVDAECLLGLHVGYQGVKLGSVSAVFVDPRGAALGVEVLGSFGAAPHFLPWPAARLADGGVEARPLALLSAEQAGFYVRRGARRVAQPGSRRPFEGSTEVSLTRVNG